MKRVLKTAAALAGTGALLCSGLSAPVQAAPASALAAPRPMLMFDGLMQTEMLPLSGKQATWSEVSRVYKTLSLAKSAVAHYASLEAARQAGYVPAPPALAMGTGSHYVNYAYMRAAFNPARPPILVYTTQGGATTLAGVMYSMPRTASAQQLQAVFPSSMAAWHQHINVCVRGATVLRVYDSGACRTLGGTFTAATNWLVHAWLWQNTGLFDMDGSHESAMDVPSAGGMTMSTTAASLDKPITMTEGSLQMRMYPLSGRAPTWTEIAKVYTMLSAAQAATTKYRDVRAALRDGYYTNKLFFVDTQGYHYVNPNYTPGRHAFSPTTPAILVYNKVGGKMTLSGLMYYVSRATTPAQMASIFPSSMASWHQHVNICFNMQKVVAIFDRTACQASGNFFVASTGWMVHAWIYEPNTVGLFAMDR